MPTGTNGKPDALPPTKDKQQEGGAKMLQKEQKEKTQQKEKQHQEEILDEALEETFPASDPIAPATPRD